jgi:predicted TIM-barrel fold metal-dependent hydrolase
VSVSPFHEEDLVSLTKVLGASNVLFGSDYPHAEGVAEPTAFQRGLAGLDESETAAIMGGNLKELLHVA